MNVSDLLHLPTIGVIFGMAAATILVRVAGFWLMKHVQMTPFVRATLEALPSTIFIATVVPLAIKAGASGIAGVVAAVLMMLVSRSDMASLALGLGTVAAWRYFF